MKLRIASKVLLRALNTGDVSRGSTLARAARAFPRGAREHPKKYWASGLTAAFVRMGYSIHDIRFGLEGPRIRRAIEQTV